MLYIVTRLLLYRQAHVMLAADYGFDKEQVVNVPLQGVPYDRVRQALQNNPYVAGVSATSFLPGTSEENNLDVWTTPGEGTQRANLYATDYGFIDNLQLTLVAGRNFSPDFATDSAQAALLNETAVRRLGLGTPQDALGQMVHVGFEHRPEDAASWAS